MRKNFEAPNLCGCSTMGLALRRLYQAVHFDDLMGGALQHAAVTTEKKVLDRSVREVQDRQRSGPRGSSGAREKPIDVTKLTKQQRNELIERARRNPDERITFS